MKKKLVIPVIFILIFLISILSGCIVDYDKPVTTIKNHVIYYNYTHHFYGGWSPFCEAKDFMVVIDTQYHDNWENYSKRISGDYYSVSHKIRIFLAVCYLNEIPQNTVIHWRAVAYCYDFKGPLRGLEDGFYQGEDKTFSWP